MAYYLWPDVEDGIIIGLDNGLSPRGRQAII